MTDMESSIQRYHDALHAMQSGVTAKMELDGAETSPKHLRVGVNSAMVDHSALVAVLMARGIITQEEYFEALAESMERERDMYQEELSSHYGANITLG